MIKERAFQEDTSRLFWPDREVFRLYFNKNRIKTWWFREKAVTLHPLFVALCLKVLSLT
jgi:hypothetical protein